MWIIFWIFLSISFLILFYFLVRTKGRKNDKLENSIISFIGTIPVILTCVVCISSINFDRLNYKFNYKQDSFHIIDSGVMTLKHMGVTKDVPYIKYKEKDTPKIWRYVLPEKSFDKYSFQ